MPNKQLIQDIYGAFSRGDIPSILNALSSDVEWIDPGAPGIPYAGTYRGREGVAQFFQKMGESTEYPRFEAREYVAEGDRVVALGHLEARSKGTGRSASTDWSMVWVIRDGKVVRFQAYVDTAAVAGIYG